VKALSRSVSPPAEAGRALAQAPNRTSPARASWLVVYKASADIVSKAVTLLVTVAAARTLSGPDFGVLAVAMTTGWLLSVASDAGLPLYLARRIALERAAGRTAFAPVSDVMRLRGGLGAVAVAAGIGVALAIAPQPVRIAFVIIVVAQLLNAAVETLSHAYRGLGRIDIEAGLILAQRGLTAAAAVTVLVISPSLPWLSAALAIPSALALAVSLHIARRGLPAMGAASPADRDGSAGSALSFAPVGLGILLSAIYFRCDVYFVERWHGLETAGIYNAAFRIVEALRLFPSALLAVVFPALCTTPDVGLLRRTCAWLLAGGLALLAAVYLAAPTALGVLYGPGFLVASPALRILALALPLFFVNYALTHQLIAWNGQRAYLAVAATALMVNLAGNTLLIPKGGMIGAAASTFVTELVVAAGSLAMLTGRRAVRAGVST
jgi:O-antigen/teichoic acid export membrane protein